MRPPLLAAPFAGPVELEFFLEFVWFAGQCVAGVLVADVISGIVHWLEDAYGDEDFPVLGRRVVEPNIRHHYSPLDFTGASYLKRNGPILVIVAVFGIVFALADWVNAFTIALLIAGSQANETHRWAHMPRDAVPRSVRWLQNRGLFLSQRHHGRHHRAPFNERYCTVTNLMNPLLDGLGVFTGIESLLRNCLGLERRVDGDRRP